MSRKHLALAGVAALLFMGAAADLATAQNKEQEKWDKKVKDICTRVARLRGLDFKTEVGVGVKTRDELLQFLMKSFDEETPEGQFEAIQRTWAKMGLVPDDMNLKKTVIDMLTSQVGGFYNPQTKKLFVISGGSAKDGKKDPMQAMMEQGMKMLGISMDDIVAAHELTHALQDQYFGLQKLDKIAAGNDDRILALKCVIEGDATIMMMEYLYDKVPFARNMGGGMKNMGSAGMGATPGMKDVPEILKTPLVYPYMGGASLVERARKKGGWKAVNVMFNDPPLSTEQILHLDKYFDERDDPVFIDLGDLEKLAPKGWKKLESNVFGELGMSILFKEFLGKEDATVASEGWDGDRFASFAKGEDVFYTWYTVWDSKDDAEEVAEAYREVLRKKFENDSKLEEEKSRDQREEGSYYSLSTPNETAVVAVYGCDVVVIEGLKSKQTKAVLGHLLKNVKKNAPEAAAPYVVKEGTARGDGFSMAVPRGWKTSKQGAFGRIVMEAPRSTARLEVGSLDIDRALDLEDVGKLFEKALPGKVVDYKLNGSGIETHKDLTAYMIEFFGLNPERTQTWKYVIVIMKKRGKAVIATYMGTKKDCREHSDEAEEALDGFKWE